MYYTPRVGTVDTHALHTRAINTSHRSLTGDRPGEARHHNRDRPTRPKVQNIDRNRWRGTRRIASESDVRHPLCGMHGICRGSFERR